MKLFHSLEALVELLEHTNRSVFLTGKAGTGKTTFLNNFVKNTRKKHIVVAPTGIAAINAGGVTIHSLFTIPPRTFVPTTEHIDRNLAMNINDLFPHFKYRKDKLKLFREIELIIIDEVSMLRADVLDMMDHSLRHVRRNQLPFGGAQLLLIGDLYQLPPVVRDDSERILSRFYNSPFFFSAKALQEVPLVTVELMKVYRQQDEEFLEILNAVRDADIRGLDFEKLNSRYEPEFEPKDEAYIYLCSHNRIADNINQKRLAELGGKTKFYKAAVVGSFSESQFPNEEVLELKVGAQIMFIRNDTSPEKKFYNGKLAEISYIDEDVIKAVLDGTEEEITLTKETWEQKKYSLDEEKNIKEEVLGSFEQYPIRLAWAVTIHKSQGLTFDRVIIDAGKSFASGQVYVALSRCRTLEGIVLKSKITPEVIFSDHRIENFQKSTNANDILEQILEQEKYDYTLHKVQMTIDATWLKDSAITWMASALSAKGLDQEKVKNLSQIFKIETEKLFDISEKFKRFIQQKSKSFIAGNIKWLEIEEKCKGAVNFFYTNVAEQFLLPLKDYYSETKGVKGLKAYNEEVKSFIDDLEEYIDRLKESYLLDVPLFDKEKELDTSAKMMKKPTHIITFQLFEEGKTPGEIAKERGLVTSTVYGHLAKMAELGLVDMERIFDRKRIRTFEDQYREEAFDNLSDWKKALPDEFEFHEIRILWNHFNHKYENKS
ncbi:helix-turn-helix domain-containing protein [Elizabethkingia anophelis]|uniref:helix-turn-helix domain-containing protein n=1 Tax=Elizabethkingia anophelis TaxID=1117645 RepID=UPI0006661C14|nr:helix-turn-helix domain-containing protein [Elizabethkingia anophelis]AQW90216.1 AAA family ATPase [Elizabethkingia anophelis]EJC8058977.1 helix-turn-helix domain-containing protein [Elizabethkingia anophelis]KUY23622.1 AAA family ATPase [Elizabethkingia anophelis]MCL1640252.1 helix-turn-helix domain-containing protein [Elizabethkingia anophelis]MCL1645330.1 helix-turn-helix domain-containing protein [Elizabethkingia anophelis]